MLITALSFQTTQHLQSFKFTLVNKSHSQHSEAAVCCEGRHFLILYACAHKVLFPDRRPRSLVWKREYTSERAGMVASFPGRSRLQYLIACSIKTVFILQAIKNWRRERPGNEATGMVGTVFFPCGIGQGL